MARIYGVRDAAYLYARLADLRRLRARMVAECKVRDAFIMPRE